MWIFLLAGCFELQMYAQEAKQAANDLVTEMQRPPMPCDAQVPAQLIEGCLSGELSCGDVIEGTTEGGEANWDDDFYSGAYCLPAGSNYSGPERVYRMVLPPYTQAKLFLQTECVDLDLVAMAWKYNGKCPSTHSASGGECNARGRRGNDEVTMVAMNNPIEYLVAIDGKAAQAGTYRLTVQCSQMR